MMPVNYVWQAILIFVTAISIYLFYLYLKEKDKRKLLFSIAFLLSIPAFIALSFGYVSSSIDESSVIWYNTFTLSALPFLYAVFIASNEQILKVKKYDTIFNIFLIISFISLILIFIPFKLTTVPTLIRLFVSFEILFVTIYSFIKTRRIENLYFIGYILTAMVAGMGFRLDYGYFSSFAFLMSYVFICFLFIQPKYSSDKKTKGIGSYFSLEKQLKTAEKRYKTLFNTIPDAITLLSPDGTILNLNDTMARNLQVDKEEIVGTNMHHLLPENVDQQRTDVAIKAFQTGEIQENEDFRNGSYFQNIYIPIETEDNQKNLMVIARNITNEKELEKEREEQLRELRRTELATLNIMEDMQDALNNLKKTRAEIQRKNTELLRKTEQLKQTNRDLDSARTQLAELNKHLEEKVQERTKEVEKLVVLKDSFIYQLGHDLKTPLTPLNSLLPIIKQKTTDAEIKKSLTVCIDKVAYMKQLVAETLDLAKMSSSSYEMQTEQTNLYQTVDSITNDFTRDNQDQNIRFDNRISKNLEVNVNPLRFTELLNNLISNAVKYSPEGGDIIIQAEEKDDDMIQISVIDHGIGLTKEQLDHIFDEFYKADESRHDFEGTGLGLSIAKKIVEKHGGTIQADSPGLGQGSIFKFTVKK